MRQMTKPRNAFSSTGFALDTGMEVIEGQCPMPEQSFPGALPWGPSNVPCHPPRQTPRRTEQYTEQSAPAAPRWAKLYMKRPTLGTPLGTQHLPRGSNAHAARIGPLNCPWARAVCLVMTPTRPANFISNALFFFLRGHTFTHIDTHTNTCRLTHNNTHAYVHAQTHIAFADTHTHTHTSRHTPNRQCTQHPPHFPPDHQQHAFFFLASPVV